MAAGGAGTADVHPRPDLQAHAQGGHPARTDFPAGGCGRGTVVLIIRRAARGSSLTGNGYRVAQSAHGPEFAGRGAASDRRWQAGPDGRGFPFPGVRSGLAQSRSAPDRGPRAWRINLDSGTAAPSEGQTGRHRPVSTPAPPRQWGLMEQAHHRWLIRARDHQDPSPASGTALAHRLPGFCAARSGATSGASLPPGPKRSRAIRATGARQVSHRTERRGRNDGSRPASAWNR